VALAADIVCWISLALVAVLSPVLGWTTLDGLWRTLSSDLRDEPDAG
jgi:hypothetical protein